MKIGWLCLFNVVLGLATGMIMARLGQPAEVAEALQIGGWAVVPSQFVAPVTEAALVVGLAGTLLATIHLALVLRRARRRLNKLGAAPNLSPSPNEWDSLLASLFSPDPVLSGPN